MKLCLAPSYKGTALTFYDKKRWCGLQFFFADVLFIAWQLKKKLQLQPYPNINNIASSMPPSNAINTIESREEKFETS